MTADPPFVDLTSDNIRRWLADDQDTANWLTELAGTAAGAPTRLPEPAEATRMMTRMEVPAADITEALDAVPDADRRPDLWWLLHHCRLLLVERLGSTAPMARWPGLPARLGALGRYFYLWVFLASVPDLLRHHAALGIAEQVSWETLADIGSKAALHRRTHGTGGLDKQDWFTLHFRGLLYSLGRLQFNLGRTPADSTMPPPGTPCLGVHIPETGPMTPQACQESLRRAPEFFHEHFAVRYRYASCTSWLLDDQLADYLPGTSNILRFQQRFRLTPGGRDSDADILEFVFRQVRPQLADLPQQTTLQRAVVRHLRAGGHWQVRTGWLELPD